MTITMAKTERVSLRATTSDRDAWERSASSEMRKLTDWAENVLNLVADSGLTVLELRELLTSHKKSSPPRKKTS